MIPGDLLSAFPHRQFHTLPGLLDSWAALPNSYPNACMPMQGGNLYHFYDGLWYDPAERRTHDLPCERRTRYRLSQPDRVTKKEVIQANNEIIYKCLSKIKLHTLHIPETHSVCMSNLWHCSLLQNCSEMIKVQMSKHIIKITSSVFGKVLDKLVPQ